MNENLDRAAPDRRVQRAGAIVRDYAERLGWAQLLEVADELGFAGAGVSFTDDQLRIRLSDLQLIAFAAALAANREVLLATMVGSKGR